ncbi:gas vesicle protein GvpJ [Rhodococcus opacus]|uniref:gas vesicle protein GvpJ n=1 Tax=Rhodococcus opacus TaxID=37919 RepID=UPI001C48D6EA|nr:gas vesicle protein GvpJ [Rhodococcus opacus]MBV6760739.1 gas vesicle protein [Rhodococcus opacus]
MTTAGGPSSSSLADVIDTILDKGLVIDAYVRVSLVGIGSEPKGLSDLVSGGTEKIAKSKTKGALESAGEKLGDLLGGSGSERELAPRRSHT